MSSASNRSKESQATPTLRSVDVESQALVPYKPKRRYVGRKARPQLSEEDQELARAVDRINANHDLLRALLFTVVQKVPEARKLVLQA